MKAIIFAMFISCFCLAEDKQLSFQEEGKTFTADLTLPATKAGKSPLVVIVHEWWGKNEFPKAKAAKLNELGMATLVVDLFGNGVVVDNPKEAGDLAGPFYKDSLLGAGRLHKYLELAKKEKGVDSKNITVIGYCFGGTQALNLARTGESIKNVVSFHGGLATGIKAIKIKANILVLNGAADPLVPAKDIDAFKNEMKTVKAKYEFVNYEGALHAFTNPKATEVGKKYSMPVAYDAKADAESWEKFLAFVK